MTRPAPESAIVSSLDAETRALVRLSAAITGGSEADLRAAMAGEAPAVRAEWVEELVLQSYLFAGFPRALNAAREWRRASGVAASATDDELDATMPEWEVRGERTCAAVYGSMYDRLRENIRALHPALDRWMIVEGYGKVLGRPGLDLVRRELCIVAACVAARQERQLHSHLHGARNVGASPELIGATLDALDGVVAVDALVAARMLWARVRGK